MELSREWVFENLLSALSSSDPLESLLIRATQICRGSGLVLNELGEVTDQLDLLRTISSPTGCLVWRRQVLVQPMTLMRHQSVDG